MQWDDVPGCKLRGDFYFAVFGKGIRELLVARRFTITVTYAKRRPS